VRTLTCGSRTTTRSWESPTAAGFRTHQAIGLAKQFTQVYTVVSIAIAAVFSCIEWVRKLRKARSATTGAALPR